MGKGNAAVLALIVTAVISGQNVALADKGGVPIRNAATPSVNLGLAAAPAVANRVGLPAGALNAPGAARSASVAGLLPPGKTKELLPPGKTKELDGVASDKKSTEGKEKVASLTGATSDAASDPAARIEQLPTCR
jgi:hypothetical protein